MSVFLISIESGRKMCRPVTTREEYLSLRGGSNLATLKEVREGNEAAKHRLVQMNYSCLPNEDGSLKGSKRRSTTVGMDIDHIPKEQMLEVRDSILQHWYELGLLMLERSARCQGFHLVFKRRQELSQEENLKWASQLLGVQYDEGATDITRIFYTTGPSEDDLIFLSDELFQIEEVKDGEEAKDDVKVEEKQDTPLWEGATDEEPKAEEASTSSLTAFDLCVKQAGLKPDEMDVWGQHNWHNNLMAVLSVGVAKLMSRQQLLAVVGKRLPNYSKTEDCKKLIDYFFANYSANKGFMNAALREINAQAQQANEDDADKDMEYLTRGWNPPPLPQKLPRLIYLLIKPFPPQYHPMLVVAACVILGTIASHYRSIYTDGRTIAANLFAAIIAGSGKGKSWVSMLMQLMCKNTLQAWDDQEWKKVYENMELRDKMSNAKERPAKYHPKLRIMETMSKTSLLEVQTNLGNNGMILCSYNESDELANASKAQFSNISVLLRKAWDWDFHRQYYMSESSCSTQCRLCAAILLTGTPKSVLTRLFADTESGTMQRFIPIISPRIKRTFRPPKFMPLSADEEAERDGLLVSLWQKDLSLGDETLMLEMPKTQKMIEAWYDKLEERYNDGELTEAEADLSHRVGQFMQRAAIPFLALYGEEKKEVTEMVHWLGDFAYYNICHIFATRVAEDMKASDEMLKQNMKGATAEPILKSMPPIFSTKQFREERIRQNQSGEVKMILSRYCKKGKIERISKGFYRNLMVTGNTVT